MHYPPPPPITPYFSPLPTYLGRYQLPRVVGLSFLTLPVTRRISILLCMSLRMSTPFYIQKRPQKKAFPIPQLKIVTIVPKGSSRIHNEKQTSV
jgi:hypothetical protein